MKLGEHLRFIRRKRKLTLKNLSQHADLSVPYLSDLERGVVNPSIETLQKVAKAYNMKVQDLFTGVEDMEASTHETYPEGFLAFLQDPEYRDELDEDWKNLLMKINYRGQRPSSKREWVELYLNLRRFFSSKED
jgi:transcriptional regulator with XRE-family HTH domain